MLELKIFCVAIEKMHKLYKLIWKRTIASQMKNAKVELTNAIIKGEKDLLGAIEKAERRIKKEKKEKEKAKLAREVSNNE